MTAKYVSVWDGGIEIRTECLYSPTTNEVWDIYSADVDGLEICEDEYVELPDGTQIRDFINIDDGQEDESLSSEDIERLKSLFKK